MASQPGRAARLVLVDDHADDLLLTRLQLEQAFPGLDVRPFNDPFDAADFLREHAADVVVSDCRMPGLDGPQLLRAAAAVVPAERCILITGYDVESQRQDAERFALFSKSDNLRDLLRALRPLLAAVVGAEARL